MEAPFTGSPATEPELANPSRLKYPISWGFASFFGDSTPAAIEDEACNKDITDHCRRIAYL